MAILNYEAIAQFDEGNNMWCVSAIGAYVQVDNQDDIESAIRAELTRVNHWVSDTTDIVSISILYLTNDNVNTADITDE